MVSLISNIEYRISNYEVFLTFYYWIIVAGYQLVYIIATESLLQA